METEIGVPIDYTTDMDFKDKMISRGKKEEYTTSIEDVLEQDEIPEQEERYAHKYREREPYQEPMYYQQHYPQPPIIYQQTDVLANMNKTSYIIIAVVFILGYFFGKSFQPVIIRPG